MAELPFKNADAIIKRFLQIRGELSAMPFERRSDYPAWKEEQAPVLDSLRGKEVWVLFSGGKDSSLALHFLHAASEEFGLSLQVHAGTFPKHRYTPSEVDRIDNFWKERGVAIQWHDVRESDDCLEGADYPCIVCQEVRKQGLYEQTRSRCVNFNKLVIVTAYTLSDLVSYSLEYLMEIAYTHLEGEDVQRSQRRFMETGHRFYPVVMMQSGTMIYRPALRYNKQEVVRIIQEASIPILSAPCRYARFRPKRMLETYYDSMRLDFDYDRVITFAKECLGLLSVDDYESMSEEHFLKRLF
jgi:tRNA(Ile)-lysidine synthase TilS/MesJ